MLGFLLLAALVGSGSAQNCDLAFTEIGFNYVLIESSEDFAGHVSRVTVDFSDRITISPPLWNFSMSDTASFFEGDGYLFPLWNTSAASFDDASLYVVCAGEVESECRETCVPLLYRASCTPKPLLFAHAKLETDADGIERFRFGFQRATDAPRSALLFQAAESGAVEYIVADTGESVAVSVDGTARLDFASASSQGLQFHRANANYSSVRFWTALGWDVSALAEDGGLHLQEKKLNFFNWTTAELPLDTANFATQNVSIVSLVSANPTSAALRQRCSVVRDAAPPPPPPPATTDGPNSASQQLLALASLLPALFIALSSALMM